jgi:hypothetical protein
VQEGRVLSDWVDRELRRLQQIAAQAQLYPIAMLQSKPVMDINPELGQYFYICSNLPHKKQQSVVVHAMT